MDGLNFRTRNMKKVIYAIIILVTIAILLWQVKNFADARFLDSGLVGYWAFEDAPSATAIDKSGKGNNATLTNGPKYTNGKIGQALDFDIVNDFVVIPAGASLRGLGAATISLWYKPKANPINNTGIYYESTASTAFSRFAIFHQANGDLRGIMRDTDAGTSFEAIQTGGANTPNQWIHAALTFSDATNDLILYRNAVQVAINGAAKGSFTTGAPIDQIAIGSYTQTPQRFINAVIDEVRIYNRALSTSEIHQLYIQGVKSRGTPNSSLSNPFIW